MKKRLIDILLENITPENWPDKYPFAAQDNCSSIVYFYDEKPEANKESQCFTYTSSGVQLTQDLPKGKKWSKNIVNRDEFVKRYNNEIKDWIIWEGSAYTTPVDVGTRVDVQYRDGVYNYHVTAGITRALDGSVPNRAAVSWRTLGNAFDIIRYRVCPPL